MLYRSQKSKPENAVFICFVAFVLNGCATHKALDQNALDASPLVGRWRNVESTIYFSDGTTKKSTAQVCWTEFLKEQSSSECLVNRSSHKVRYTYRLRSPNTIESEVVKNDGYPSTIGTRVTTEFRIEGDKMFTTAYPPRLSDGAPKAPVKVEGSWVRERAESHSSYGTASSLSDYHKAIAQIIKRNIIFDPTTVAGNPAAEIQIQLNQTGKIRNVTVLKSSGFRSWDDAVLRAIERTSVLPLLDPEAQYKNLTLVFYPQE